MDTAEVSASPPSMGRYLNRHQQNERDKPTALRVSRRSHRAKGWQRRWHYFYLRFIRLQGTSEAIARGLAVGTFAGMFPIFGFQIICGVLLAAIIRGNKIAAATATWISNPLTYVPLLAFNFQVGQWLLKTNELTFTRIEPLSWRQVVRLGTDFMSTLFLGCLVMGSIAAVISYFGGLWLVHHLRHRHYARRAKRVHRSRHD